MATFLRDKRISNVTLDENALTEIFTVFERRADALRALSHVENEESFVFAIIRFDGKGYRVHSCDELLQYFRSSRTVERIVVRFQSSNALSSNNAIGSFIELRLDGSDPNSCTLQVSSDYSEWVDASFCTLEESLRELKNRHGWSRSRWFSLLIQLSGVLAALMVSLWSAVVLTPRIPVENAFVIVFLFVLLIVSNAWDYVKSLILNTIDRLYPNVMFFRPDKDRYRWLKQSVTGGIVVAIVLSVLHLIIRYVGDELSRFFSTGP